MEYENTVKTFDEAWKFCAVVRSLLPLPPFVSLYLFLESAIYLIEIPSVFPTRWNENVLEATDDGGAADTGGDRRRAFDNTIYGRGRWRINFYGDQVAAAARLI